MGYLSLYFLDYSAEQLSNKAADVVGKLFFWIENSVIYIGLAIYSWFLIPIIFVKFIITIFRNCSFIRFMMYLIPWLFLGFPYLGCLIYVDLFNLTRILADYRDDVASQEEKK